MSPATLLRKRHGNCFEMATLLCSMLIGAGFPAMVVSGSAKIQTTTNDQRNVNFPLPIDEPIQDDTDDDVKFEISDTKYLLKPKPELVSHLEEKLEKIRILKEEREKLEEEKNLQKIRNALDDDTYFKNPIQRTHAWVAIVNNAPWSTKPRTKIYDEDGEEIEAPPSVSFIEPTTGCVHETSSSAYVHVESVWNDLNYYVNLQKCRIHELKWDLRETSNWEHFLVAEPAEMRVIEELSDENLGEETNQISVEKHLDMGRSWVDKLYISDKEFDEQFPQRFKAIYYKRVLHERFASHSEEDGKKEQITSYLDDKYQERAMRWTWYDNRSDLLVKVRHDYLAGDIEESFLKGRPDSLKYYLHNEDKKRPNILYFFSIPRVDSLKYAHLTGRSLVLKFEKSPGKCFYKEFLTKAGMATHIAKLRDITEKFHRDPDKPPGKDVAFRRFLLAQNKIQIKFHYARGALTAETREFIKPPKPDYGLEIIFNPELTEGAKYGTTDPDSTQLELYLLLLDSLKAEEAAKKSFELHIDELNGIIAKRKQEMKKIILKFKAFDPLRNAAARKIRMEMDAKEEEEKRKRRENLPDFLAPYLVPYAGRSLTREESWAAYNACLGELKTRFVSLLNELQRRYEDLTAEALSLKKFLNKFQNKFEDFDYERLLKESKELELHKRMVQKRLTITHEEAQKKYDLVKQSLLKDPRLNLNTGSLEVFEEVNPT